jgi:hypothetical protein
MVYRCIHSPLYVVLSLYPSLYDCMLVQYVKPNSLECYALNRIKLISSH